MSTCRGIVPAVLFLGALAYSHATFNITDDLFIFNGDPLQIISGR